MLTASALEKAHIIRAIISSSKTHYQKKSHKYYVTNGSNPVAGMTLKEGRH